MDQAQTSDRITLDLHGVRFDVTSTSDVAFELLCDRLEGYDSHSEDPSEAVLILTHEPPPFPPDEVRKEFSWIRSRPLWGDFRNDILRLTDGRSVSMTRYKERTAEIFLHPETLGDRPFSMRTFLPLPILELLRTFGFFYVHAALLERKGRGLLILGHGGSGKSTLSAALLTDGWRIVGDDNLLFHLGPEGKSIGFPFERELSVTPETAVQLTLPVLPSSDGGKIRIPLDRLPPDMVAGSVVPDRILYLEGHDTESSQRIDPSVAFSVIVEENPLLLLSPSLATVHLETIRSLVGNAACQSLSWKWTHPPDLRQIAASFQALKPSLISPP